jgi:hypothetical protein
MVVVIISNVGNGNKGCVNNMGGRNVRMGKDPKEAEHTASEAKAQDDGKYHYIEEYLQLS